MSRYKILPYSFEQAKRLGVIIKPSSNPKKKIDVFKNGVKLASVGDPNYKDFPYYTKENGIEFAKGRQRLYRIRHERNRKKVGSASYWSDQILW